MEQKHLNGRALPKPTACEGCVPVTAASRAGERKGEHHSRIIVSTPACKTPRVARVQPQHVGFCIFMPCFLALEVFRAFHTLNIGAVFNLFAVVFPSLTVPVRAGK